MNDANILIDLVELKLLSQFFDLKFEFQTTELIIEELLEEQAQALLPYINRRALIVQEVMDADLIEIRLIEMSKPTLSLQDCSAYYQARKLNAILLSSDNSLRKFARENNIDIHGHLWIFDQMVAANTLTGSEAAAKLTELRERINTRLGLPKQECAKRIKRWTNSS